MIYAHIGFFFFCNNVAPSYISDLFTERPTSSPGVPFVMRWKLGPLARPNDIPVLNGYVNTID